LSIFRRPALIRAAAEAAHKAVRERPRPYVRIGARGVDARGDAGAALALEPKEHELGPARAADRAAELEADDGGERLDPPGLPGPAPLDGVLDYGEGETLVIGAVGHAFGAEGDG
jgi:hypothetical protein